MRLDDLAVDDWIAMIDVNLMGPIHIIEAFVRFREEVITRRSKFELAKARDRAHILLGLVIAVTNLDEVVRIIRGSASPAAAPVSCAVIVSAPSSSIGSPPVTDRCAKPHGPWPGSWAMPPGLSIKRLDSRRRKEVTR